MICITFLKACVAFNYDKTFQNCFLLQDFGVSQEKASFVSGPKTCGNINGE
jgi:hypothetical protein